MKRLLLLLLLTLLACQRSAPTELAYPQGTPTGAASGSTPLVFAPPNQISANPLLPPTREPGQIPLIPTPDAPHPLAPLRSGPDQYVVQPNDTLNNIAERYGVSLEAISQASGITNPNLISVGQIITIPRPEPGAPAPDFKIIPNAELVYSPYAALFSIPQFVEEQGGYLFNYRENVENRTLTGAQIVERVALDFSVNPRLLLAVLQYQSRWVTQPDPRPNTLDYPMGFADPNRKGLYRQLSWAANELNRGYYLWQVNAINSWVLANGAVIPASPLVNAGTAAVHALMAKLYGEEGWRTAVSEQGIFAFYVKFFGYPFDYAYEPLLPEDLRQPELQLPFEPLKVWSFTGGPHGAWGSGSAWGAIDFAPPGEALGCVQSNEWVIAMADGLILRAENGAVLQDLDGDGYEQTGWVLLYMHIESRDRVRPSTFVRAGERIGHPSCEGGFSNGTHVHIARKYNGQWISADGSLPFVLDGWVSVGAGNEYDGYLQRGGESLEAWAGRAETNQIQR